MLGGMGSHEGRLPKPDWNQFNSLTKQHIPLSCNRLPPQRRPTAAKTFNNNYGRGAADSADYVNIEIYTHKPPHILRGRGRGGRGHHNKTNYQTSFNGFASPNNHYPNSISNEETPSAGFRQTQPQYQYHNSRPRAGGRRGSCKRSNGGRRNQHQTNKQRTPRSDIIPEEIQDDKCCCECGDLDSSYKCPQCRLKYCSVSCYKAHKGGTNCVLPSDIECETRNSSGSSLTNRLPGRVEYLYPTGDTIKPEGLEKLAQGPLRCRIVDLMKSQHLRDKIRSLDSSKDPRALMNSFTDDKEFTEFKKFVIENLSSDLFS